MLKYLSKMLLITVIIGLVAFLVFFFLKANKSDETVLDEKYDKQGRLTMQVVEGYDCCEGFYEKTKLFDTLENVVEEFGIQDGLSFKNTYQYKNDRLVFGGYYSIENDSVYENFDKNDPRIDSKVEHHYYVNGQPKINYHLSFYTNQGKGDTTYYSIERTDSLGNKLEDIHLDISRIYQLDSSTQQYSGYQQLRILENRLNESIDTSGVTYVEGSFERDTLK